MKVVILAGGQGTRLSEETELRPKPMVEIGGRPILWHIMKIFAKQDFNDFVILIGHKGEMIKEYFRSHPEAEWKISLVETGLETMTGARLKLAQKQIGEESFFLTYGDGVANIDLHELLKFHKNHPGSVTITSVRPEPRFGSVTSDDQGKVILFSEKPEGDQWINGGFFVCNIDVFNYVSEASTCTFEREPLEKLTVAGKLWSYKHHGFWKCMDTLRDKKALEHLWVTTAPWKLW